MQILCQFTLCLNFLRSTNAKNSTDITANTAPTKPIYDIAPLSHTIPPIQLPPPIPRLKSPEYMAVATAELFSSTLLMTSDCVVTLNAMAVIPQNAHRSTMVANVFDAGSRSSSHTRRVAMTVPINANLCLS